MERRGRAKMQPCRMSGLLHTDCMAPGRPAVLRDQCTLAGSPVHPRRRCSSTWRRVRLRSERMSPHTSPQGPGRGLGCFCGMRSRATATVRPCDGQFGLRQSCRPGARYHACPCVRRCRRGKARQGAEERRQGAGHAWRCAALGRAGRRDAGAEAGAGRWLVHAETRPVQPDHAAQPEPRWDYV